VIHVVSPAVRVEPHLPARRKRVLAPPLLVLAAVHHVPVGHRRRRSDVPIRDGRRRRHRQRRPRRPSVRRRGARRRRHHVLSAGVPRLGPDAVEDASVLRRGVRVVLREGRRARTRLVKLGHVDGEPLQNADQFADFGRRVALLVLVHQVEGQLEVLAVAIEVAEELEQFHFLLADGSVLAEAVAVEDHEVDLRVGGYEKGEGFVPFRLGRVLHGLGLAWISAVDADLHVRGRFQEAVASQVGTLDYKRIQINKQKIYYEAQFVRVVYDRKLSTTLIQGGIY
jgi:hypothetical protein